MIDLIHVSMASEANRKREGGGGGGWLQDLSEILTGKKKKKGFRSWLVSNIELKVGGPVPLAPASPRFRCV